MKKMHLFPIHSLFVLVVKTIFSPPQGKEHVTICKLILSKIARHTPLPKGHIEREKKEGILVMGVCLYTAHGKTILLLSFARAHPRATFHFKGCVVNGRKIFYVLTKAGHGYFFHILFFGALFNCGHIL